MVYFMENPIEMYDYLYLKIIDSETLYLIII